MAAPTYAEDALANVETVVSILEKYQEQSSLLDPHLETLMDILTSRARVVILAGR